MQAQQRNRQELKRKRRKHGKRVYVANARRHWSKRMTGLRGRLLG